MRILEKLTLIQIKVFLCCFLFFSSLAADLVRVVPVASTPEPSVISLTVSLPEPGQIVYPPIYVQFRVDGFSLGSDSQFSRASEVANSSMGQTVHVIVDNLPYFEINEPAVDPFDETGNYFNASYRFQVPYRLTPGAHTLRMFLARSFGEGIKGERAFVAFNFYVDSLGKKLSVDLSRPFLTYNEPSPGVHFKQGMPILLDFYITNAELSEDGYKVRLLIDGKEEGTLTSWQPYYIYGLTKGSHDIHLELLSSQGKRVPGAFNSVSQTIQVY